ncbi:hypothetical protein CDD81_7062 [Ophiocordyceps australis]|uniref:Uncharacterized protein n=1 Tax=Ophiocordyceps australis TaxID=1399860 RepID=A0A2C5X968_9HYPO|nr:hypothetical protein CDD81_7062 [Ophiocordyceps australis]
MSIPSAVFERGLDAVSSPMLSKLIQQHLESAVRDVEMTTAPAPNSGDLMLNDMGDYFSRTAMLWACLADRLIKGPELEEANYMAHERSRAGSGMSDLSEVARVDVDISRLRKIRDLSIEFSRQVQSTWRPQTNMLSSQPVLHTAPVSPFCDAKLSSIPGGLGNNGSMPICLDNGDPRAFKSRKLLPDSHVQIHHHAIHSHNHHGHSLHHPPDLGGHRSEDSEESDDDIFMEIDMDALRQRGKGNYSCPKAYKCKKGGVDKDGSLVKFDRNSSFAQHCNKHRKPWRCDVPGCPNPPKKRRFARRDGLERHKATVKHSVGT